MEIPSDARHDLKRRFETVACNQFFRTEVLVFPSVLLGPRIAIRVKELLTVIGEVMVIESESGRRLHLQQPIDLLECCRVTMGEDFVDYGPNKSTKFKGRIEEGRRCKWTHLTL